jgi:hypothetical protein
MPLKNLDIQNPVDVTTQFFSSPLVVQTEEKSSSDNNLAERRSVPIKAK